MSTEDEFLRLAREREDGVQLALDSMMLEPPDVLRRQLRTYLSRQVDHGRIEHTDEKIPRLATVEAGLNELTCPDLGFSSGARLQFKIRLAKDRRGWLIKQFRFHIHLSHKRSVKMVRIYLRAEAWHDPLAVPRCHMHIGDSQAHVPFPVMDPRLILHLICEHIAPDFGA